jgi:spore coat polysaccharide biosynthesis protein SpsF
MKMFVIIIQARMGSTRLPGKVMKQLLNKEIISWVYDRSRMSNVDNVIIATSTNKENDILEKYFKKNNMLYYRGLENDLLDRYYQIAKNINNSLQTQTQKQTQNEKLYIIRVTSDCPFIDPNIINNMIDFYKSNEYNYIINHNLNAVTPEGSCVEIIDFQSLEHLWLNEKDMGFREHATGLLGVTNKYNDIIKIGRYEYLPNNIDIDLMKFEKVSIDTEEDYKKAVDIVNFFGRYDFSYDELLIYIQNLKLKIKN